MGRVAFVDQIFCLISLVVLVWGCADNGTASVDAWPETGRDLAGRIEAAADGAAGTAVDFVLQGCEQRTAEQCVGSAPLRLTFVPIGVQPEMIASWDLGDGSEPQQALTVTHTFVTPGTYSVTLTVSHQGGTESERKVDLVWVRAALPGGPCRETSGCAFGSCSCLDGECQPVLAGGLCLQPCGIDSPCPEGASMVCVDLSGATDNTGDVPLEPWRTQLCLPSCHDDDDCVRLGFTCRAARTPTRAWASVCLPPNPLPLGEPCRDPSGQLSPRRCVGAICLDLGAGGYCSSTCEGADCPDGADCVRFSSNVGTDAVGICLQRCTGEGTSCQGDVLLSCEQADASGELGFELLGATSPAVSGHCAPRRCGESGESGESEVSCGAGARCDAAKGGFCVTEYGK